MKAIISIQLAMIAIQLAIIATLLRRILEAVK